MRSLIISAHDFRSRRKTSVHFIVAEMAKRGTTSFFSVGLSQFSKYRGDIRSNLSDCSNRIEVVDGVQCYLWEMFWHPFKLRTPMLAALEAAIFRLYRYLLPAVPRRWIKEADVVFIESGMTPIFIADVRRLNPNACIVYLASDDLTVIGCADTVKRDFIRNFDMIDVVRLPSRHLLDGMPHGRTSILAPHGIDRRLATRCYPDPYQGKLSCVSLGSMLFDASFFCIAAKAFPTIDFHVIGAGRDAVGLDLPNIIIHPEMAFEETLPYLQHAAFGVAPYRDTRTSRYLVDTSLKLRQFGLFGIPAVCPKFALGDIAGRFGYLPGDIASIRAAIIGALANDLPIIVDLPSWSEVVDRILRPQDFADTCLS
ncbi:MAG: hypothetical protein ACRYFY_19795 [Janthinobacterium lividum]